MGVVKKFPMPPGTLTRLSVMNHGYSVSVIAEAIAKAAQALITSRARMSFSEALGENKDRALNNDGMDLNGPR